MNEQRFKTNVTLTPSNNKLVGRYNSNVGNVCVLLDSALSEFSVAMPPLENNLVSMYWMFNLPTSGDGHDVTITARRINYTLTEMTVSPGECAIITDFKSGYLAVEG